MHAWLPECILRIVVSYMPIQINYWKKKQQRLPIKSLCAQPNLCQRHVCPCPYSKLTEYPHFESKIYVRVARSRCCEQVNTIWNCKWQIPVSGYALLTHSILHILDGLCSVSWISYPIHGLLLPLSPSPLQHTSTMNVYILKTFYNGISVKWASAATVTTVGAARDNPEYFMQRFASLNDSSV